MNSFPLVLFVSLVSSSIGFGHEPTKHTVDKPTIKTSETSFRGDDLRPKWISRNFITIAPTEDAARAYGELAENLRKEIAGRWLEKAQPDLESPCRLTISIDDTTSGYSTFVFGEKSTLLSSKAFVFGTDKSIRSNSLPHEISHVVFAQYYGVPVPRWIDEGIAMLSETKEEGRAQDLAVRKFLNAGKGTRLSALFSMNEYPADRLPVFYAQSYSVADFLMRKAGDTRRVVEFLESSRTKGWAGAAKSIYSYSTIDDLQEDWLVSLGAKAAPVAKADPPLLPAPRQPQCENGVCPVPGKASGRLGVSPDSQAKLVPPTINPQTDRLLAALYKAEQAMKRKEFAEVIRLLETTPGVESITYEAPNLFARAFSELALAAFDTGEIQKAREYKKRKEQMEALGVELLKELR